MKTEQASDQTAKRSDDTVEDEPGSLSGNLTTDPVLRYTAKGRAVANMRIAVSDRVFSGGEWVNTDTEYYTVTCWGQLAENVAATLRRGDRVCAIGYWHQDTWTDTNTGEKRSEDKLTAIDFGPSVLWHTAVIKRSDRETAKRPSKQQTRRPVRTG